MFKLFTRSKTRVSVFAAVFILLALSVSATADIRIVLEYPGNILPSTVSLDFYAGVPTGSSVSETSFPTAFENAAIITRIRPETTNGNTWIVKQPGTYCYFVRNRVLTPTTFDYGRIYAVMKVIWIDPSEWPQGATSYGDGTITKTITKTLLTGPMGRNGFEPNWDPFLPKLADMPFNYFSGTPKTDGRDRTQGIHTDEVEALYSTNDLVGFPAGGFKTPAFTVRPKGMYQVSTHDDMMEFTKEIARNSPKAHWFTLADAIDDATGKPYGKTPNLSYDIPIVIVTNETIPANATFAQAAKIIRESGKLNFWHNAQIHANETSSGEGAMAMLAEMVGPFGEKYLERINYICLPRYNVEGSYIWQRTNARNIDMNRDHMRLKTVETRMIHKAYLEIMPQVCEDGHEYDFYSVTRTTTIIPNTGSADSRPRLVGLPEMAMYTKAGGSSMAADDIQFTPASSLNNPSWEVNNLAADVFGLRLANDLTNAGLRFYHYGETANNSIGRAWMGLMGSVTFVIEVRGLGGGRINYERRTFAHYRTPKSLLDTSYEYHDTVKTEIAKGRQAMIDKGRVFSSADVIALAFNSSSAANATYPGKHTFPFTGYRLTHNMKGEMVSRSVISNYGRSNNITRSRPRPTAYVIPKGIERSTADGVATVTAANGYAVNYSYLLDLLKWQGIYFYEVPPGTSAPLRQYYRSDTGNGTTGSTIRADLRSEDIVSLDKGAYVVPMDQVAGAVIAMLFEPDTDGSASYNSSVLQTTGDAEAFALIFHDITTRNFPYYRLEKDNPRQTIQDPSLVVASVTLNSADVTLQVGASGTLRATVLPATALNKNVTWTSSNTNTVSVDQTGRILARTAGTATITVSSDEKPSIAAKCNVTVSAPVITITTQPAPTATFTVGSISGDLSLAASVTGTGVTLSYQWYSNTTNSNSGGTALSGATSARFTIPTNLAVGTYYYYCEVRATGGAVTRPSNVSTVMILRADNVPVTGVTMSTTSVKVPMSTKFTLTANVVPSNATNKNVKWSSSNAAVATVSNTGEVTALSIGTAVITVTTEDGNFPATCSINVIPIIVNPDFPYEITDVASNTDIPAGDLEVVDNKVYLKKGAADAIAKAELNAKTVETNVKPVFTVPVSPGGVAQVSIKVTGKELLATNPEDIIVIGMTSGTTGKRFDYVNSESQYAANKFTLLLGGVVFNGEIDPNEVYDLVVFIEDGGKFDLDNKVNGRIVSEIFFATEKSKTGGGGGGCSAYGYLAFALLAVPFIFKKRK